MAELKFRGTILCVVGARPNFMKIAPIVAALSEQGFDAPIVHTGQHYDEAMNEAFFRDLGIPQPLVNLAVGSASHAVQTAEIMMRFEPILDRMSPRAILVVGDVNSTIACALVAAKKGVTVIHVEAGLRSYDRAMPEEVNRVLTDQISDFLFITEESARANLEREGISPQRVHFVGNVMIDSLYRSLDKAVSAKDQLPPGIAGKGYVVATLHRPSNVDEPAVLGGLLGALNRMAETLPVVLPLHPRTRSKAVEYGMAERLAAPGMVVLPPAGYLEMLGLMRDARLVVTDSGGLQEETTALGVPCLTVRENTERPITIELGTNSLVGTDPVMLLAAFDDVLSCGGKSGRVPPLWDGKASDRIAAILAEKL